MDGADISVGKNDLGARAIMAIDRKSGLRVVIPLDEAGAKIVAAELTKGLVVVHGKLPLMNGN